MGLIPFLLSLKSGTTVIPDPPPPAGEPSAVISTYKSVSNKYVDLTFDYGVYEDDGPVTVDNFEIIDFVPGGVTNIAIAAVKVNNHYTSGSATALIGGELVVRVFLTLTGTPDSTESFRIRATVTSPDDVENSSNSATIKLNITPLMLWDATETASVTTLSLGISELTDVMGLANFTQSTDANRPIHASDLVGFNRATPHHMSAGATQAAFQKGDSFTVAVKRLKSNNSGTTGYVISRRGANTNNQGWSISVGVDGSLFFVLRTTAAQGFCDYDGFSPSSENTLFFVNNNGTLNIKDSAGNNLGTTGDASALGTITYTGINLLIGRRTTETTEYWSGYFEKVAIFNKALTTDEIADVTENFDDL